MQSRYQQQIRKMTPGSLGGQSRVATPVANIIQVSGAVSVPAATNEPLPEPLPEPVACPTLLWQAPEAEADQLPAFQVGNLWNPPSVVWNGRLYGVDWGAGTGGTSALVSISIVDPTDLRVEHPTMVAYGLQTASPDEVWVLAEGPAPDYPTAIVPLSDPSSPLISWGWGELYDGLVLGMERWLSYHPVDGQLYLFSSWRESTFGPEVAFRVYRIDPTTGAATMAWTEPFDSSFSSPYYSLAWYPTRDGAFWRFQRSMGTDQPELLVRHELDGWTASTPWNPSITRMYSVWPDGGSSDRLAFEGEVDGVFGWFSIDPSGEVRAVKKCAAERGIDEEAHFWLDSYVWHSPTQDRVVARVWESQDGGVSWLYSLYDLTGNEA